MILNDHTAAKMGYGCADRAFGGTRPAAPAAYLVNYFGIIRYESLEIANKTFAVDRGGSAGRSSLGGRPHPPPPLKAVDHHGRRHRTGFRYQEATADRGCRNHTRQFLGNCVRQI